MNKQLLKACLERVVVVTRAWADDASLASPLRHMSLHVHRLACEAVRHRDLSSSSIRNVELRFCLMCRRLKAGQGECTQKLEQCQLLQPERASEKQPLKYLLLGNAGIVAANAAAVADESSCMQA